jgi:hypothetical protein
MWMAVFASALMFSGCGEQGKPVSPAKVKETKILGKDMFSLEVEDFKLTNAEVQKLEGAGGGKVVVFKDDYSRAEKTIQLGKGKYEVTVYALGPSFDEDAFYLTVGNLAEERRWPENPGELLPTQDTISLTQEADGPCNITLRFGEKNVQLDRVQFKPVP